MDIFEMFYNNRNEEQAIPMAKYMRDIFPFLGFKKPERVKLSKEFLKAKRREDKIDWDFIFKCYQMPEREFQYLAIDYMEKVKDKFTPKDMENIEKLITTKSWWDSVDAISKIVGHVAIKYPRIKEDYIIKWMKSDNIWLKRTSIIFQLQYKDKTDTDFLAKAILYNSQTDEFFINKAIGWALREYSKTNKEWVKNFIDKNALHPLSVREGSKYL
ncbi:DNA alkylation repair protein [Tepidimicrobium xylanilyticum]|uniref:DNA-7-methylguanine glycosylase n=1 Tax=Tepidimicrobium xylanilyticum TaxID=1123352 RepID=A0A1H3BYZ1_9FIRM|nr:DNA alkylation repair protein [Tepidimicrobium xylanilyticum]GMG97297.1 DNA alkylation repair protein [Tepidimicrobium xylanilyticum]SDX47127.1 DNA-7-methylguanine glycosylase [Tepidimicrobium xylanilyticum]